MAQEPVGLQVALVDDVEPVLVAQLQEPRIGRVVAGPDAVDVVLLHQQHVLAHGCLGDGPAAVGIELVPVHPAEQHPPPVHGQDAVADGHSAEADLQRHGLPGSDERAVVAPGRFGRPGLHRGHGHGFPGRRVDAQLRHGDPGRTSRITRRVHLDAQRARAGAVVVVRVHEVVADAAFGPGQQHHPAEDAGQPPHVLVLQVAAGRPLVHPDREQVLLTRRADHTGHVELGRQPAAGDNPQLGPVQPDPGTRVHPVEAEHDPARRPAGRHAEPDPVVPGRVVGRHPGRVHRERVPDVGVGRGAVAVQLPVRRDRQRGPVPVNRRRLGEISRPIGPRRPAELPVPGQVQLRRAGPEPGPGRLRSGPRVELLPVRRLGHGISLPWVRLSSLP